MASREALTEFASAQKRVVDFARQDLQAFWDLLDLSNPENVRNELLDFVPALVQQYGDVAATAAAEWYEELRRAAIGGSYQAVTAGTADPEAIAGSVRYAAGSLFSDSPQDALALINGAVQRLVQYSGRETVTRNVATDRSKPRFARVPQGVTCAWCTLLASRGFVYHSKRTAGETKHFHDDCDCQIVPSWDKSPYIEGYDPEEMYGQYMTAREAAGSGNQRDIAAAMRRLYPESFTDGVTPTVEVSA